MSFHLSVMPEQAIIRSADASKPTKRRVDDTNHPKVVLDFSSGATQYAYFRLPIPPQNEIGTFASDATLNLQYTSNSALTGNVQFGIKYAIIALGEGQDKALSSEVASTTSSYTGSTNTHYGVSFTLTGVFSALDPATRYVLVLQITRRTPASDLAADVSVVGGVLRIGSEQTTPYFSASGNDGIPDPIKWYPMKEDIVDDVDGDAPTITGTVSYAHSPALGRDVAWFDSAAYARYSGANLSDYQMAGAMSLMVYIEPKVVTAGIDQPVIGCQSNGDLEADNALWTVYQNNTTLRFFSEHGAGVNDFVNISGVKLNPYAGFMYGASRNADGITIRHFINGVFIVETDSVNAPTGGGTAEFIINYNFALSRYVGAIAQFALWDVELTDEQMAAAHRAAAPKMCV